MDNSTTKEKIFLNTVSSKFLEKTNYNYLYIPLNQPTNCMEEFIMPEIKLGN
jgi:hypothetical protein